MDSERAATFKALFGAPHPPSPHLKGAGSSSQRPGSTGLTLLAGAMPPPWGNKATSAKLSPQDMEIIPEGLIPKECLGKQQSPKAKLPSLVISISQAFWALSFVARRQAAARVQSLSDAGVQAYYKALHHPKHRCACWQQASKWVQHRVSDWHSGPSRANSVSSLTPHNFTCNNSSIYAIFCTFNDNRVVGNILLLGRQKLQSLMY